MWVWVLGSAAGGGFPQWNCACPPCRAGREGSRPARPRTQSSVAVSADRRRWSLLNASPDARAQPEFCTDLHPDGAGGGPVAAALLTGAGLDHTLGLPLRREGGGLVVHASEATRDRLYDGTAVLRTREPYCPGGWRPVVPGGGVPLGDGLSYRAFDVPTTKRARFGSGTREGRVAGYRLTDERSGRGLVHPPVLPELTPAVRAQREDCARLLAAATCRC